MYVPDLIIKLSGAFPHTFKSLFRKCDEMIFDLWKTCAVMQVLATDVPGTVHDDTQQHILYEL